MTATSEYGYNEKCIHRKGIYFQNNELEYFVVKIH
jgi:hypothetical protein